jgi:hypothetical protein
MLDTQRTVEIPGKADSPRTAAWLVIGEVAVELGIVVGLKFPAYDTVLDMYHPAAAASAVDAVGAAHHLVVLPPIPVELFPSPVAGAMVVLDSLVRHYLILLL